MNYASKVIEIAEAEVGYLEKKSNSQLDDKTANAVTTFNATLNKPYHNFLGILHKISN